MITPTIFNSVPAYASTYPWVPQKNINHSEYHYDESGYNFIETIDIKCSTNVWREGDTMTLTVTTRNEWNLEVDFNYCNVTIESIDPPLYRLSPATARGTGYMGSFAVFWENQGWATNTTHVYRVTVRMLEGMTPQRMGTEQPRVPSIWVYDSIGGSSNRCVHVLPLQASTITIRSDGTITPSNAPITR